MIKFFCILRARGFAPLPALTELRLMKTAIVTGGSSGIGLSCCRKFLENGYRVYELSRREPKIQTVGVKHISCDVTDEHSVSEAFKKIYNDSGSIDILVNNAGFGISGAVEFTELAEAKNSLTSISSAALFAQKRN